MNLENSEPDKDAISFKPQEPQEELVKVKASLKNISLLLLSILDLEEVTFLLRLPETLESLVMNGSHLSLRSPTVTKRQVHLLEVSFFP